MAPTLEEEPVDLDEVGVGEWVALGEEDRVPEEAGVLIAAPGPASGVSEKEGWSVRRPSDGEKRVLQPPTARDSSGSQVPLTWDIHSVCHEDGR
jgi:hypothetical protein